MDDRWTLKSGSDTLWIESDTDSVVSVFIHDDAEGSGICVTHDEACRIALELLRRVGVFDHVTIRELRARHILSAFTG